MEHLPFQLQKDWFIDHEVKDYWRKHSGKWYCALSGYPKQGWASWDRKGSTGVPNNNGLTIQIKVKYKTSNQTVWLKWLVMLMIWMRPQITMILFPLCPLNNQNSRYNLHLKGKRKFWILWNQVKRGVSEFDVCIGQNNNLIILLGLGIWLKQKNLFLLWFTQLPERQKKSWVIEQMWKVWFINLISFVFWIRRKNLY